MYGGKHWALNVGSRDWLLWSSTLLRCRRDRGQTAQQKTKPVGTKYYKYKILCVFSRCGYETCLITNSFHGDCWERKGSPGVTINNVLTLTREQESLMDRKYGCCIN